MLALAGWGFVARFRAGTEIGVTVLGDMRLGSWARKANAHPIMQNPLQAFRVFGRLGRILGLLGLVRGERARRFVIGGNCIEGEAADR